MNKGNKTNLKGLRRGAVLVGMVSVDIVKHSKIKGSDKDLTATRSSFLSMAEEQLPKKGVWKVSRQGDGEAFLFDINKCDEMVLFADRLCQLVPYFNRTKNLLNNLPEGRDVHVRVVCHAGEVVNLVGSSGDLGGEALSLLLKHERKIGKTDKVTLTNDVYRHLTQDVKSRCVPGISNESFGQSFILDGGINHLSIQINNSESKQLRDWITMKLKQGKYKHLFYFGYTNERLRDFLGYELSGINVKILVRDWLVERSNEQNYNQSIFEAADKTSASARPWHKSDMIKINAKELMESDNWKKSRASIDIRFYQAPPFFTGAILLNDDPGHSCANIGIIQWVEQPKDGGSQYKLDEWAGIVLDGNVGEHQKMLDYSLSRFRELWSQSLTYQQMCEKEDLESTKNPSTIKQIWSLDGQVYKIIYPLRTGANKNFPVVYHEDVRAFRAVEGFLKDFGIKSELHNFRIRDGSASNFFPRDEERRIEDWDGHIVYICARSISPNLVKYLNKVGFPIEFEGVGSTKPYLHDQKTQNRWISPMDDAAPRARDYSLIGRFQRANKKSFGYVMAGIHSPGTWGAASYFTNPMNIGALAQITNGENFAAILETEFDTITRENKPSRLIIAPQVF